MKILRRIILVLAVGSLALVGPEGGSFSIDFVGSEDFWHLEFSEPFDFGDRDGYECAFVEVKDGGEVIGVIEFERLDPTGELVGGAVPDNYLVILDRDGHEHNDGANPIPIPPADQLPSFYDPDEDGVFTLSGKSGQPAICGTPPGAGAPTIDPIDQDHFPHGTVITVFDSDDGREVAVLDLRAPGTWPESECIKPYWTPGDEPGEAYLWWDDDNPVKVGTNGPACDYDGQPGGPLDAFAIARAEVRLAPGYGSCVADSEAGDWCEGLPVPSPSPSPSPEPVCYSGTLVAEDGSGRTLEARVCE
jgi:hypothetical protein